jgi:hypothetical protein
MPRADAPTRLPACAPARAHNRPQPCDVLRGCRARVALVAVMSTVIFKVAHGVGLDGLLACLTTGLLLANRR